MAPPQAIYTVSQKSEPPKHFASATANQHRFKWNFTHTRRHLSLSSTSNFIRIRYSVYEMFNSFKLLSQISVADTTSSLRPLPDTWRRPSERTIDWRVASFWSEHYWQSSESVAWSTALLCTRKRGTLRISDLTVVTDINCDETHALWVMLFKNSYFSTVKADLYETM